MKRLLNIILWGLVVLYGVGWLWVWRVYGEATAHYPPMWSFINSVAAPGAVIAWGRCPAEWKGTNHEWIWYAGIVAVVLSCMAYPLWRYGL